MATSPDLIAAQLARMPPPGKSCFHDGEKEVRPQDSFPFHQLLLPMPGLDEDGMTVREFDLKAELTGRYFCLLFFPLDFTADAEMFRSFAALLNEFKFNETKVVAVTADSPYVTRRWTQKKEGERWYIGGPPGFIILSDKDQYLSHLLGVSRECGTPARATFLVDCRGHIRYLSCQRSYLPCPAAPVLRLVRAFRHSDFTGDVIPAAWNRPGDEVMHFSIAGKLEYFRKKYGTNQAAQNSGSLGDSGKVKVKEEGKDQVTPPAQESEKNVKDKMAASPKEEKETKFLIAPVQQSDKSTTSDTSKPLVAK